MTLLYRLGACWMAVTGIVAGVDTYSGMQCARRTGGYIRVLPANATPAAQDIAAFALAIPYGAVRGVIYNFSQAVGGEGACGHGGYTAQFAGQLGTLFKSEAVSAAYRFNQSVLGFGGAIAGGIIAEEMPILGRFASDIDRTVNSPSRP